MSNKRDGVFNESIVFPLTVSDPLGNVYDSRAYDQASYDDTDNFDDFVIASGNTVAILPYESLGNVYDSKMYDESSYDDTGDFDRPAPVAGNTAALLKTSVITVHPNTVALRSTVIALSGNTVSVQKLDIPRSATSDTAALKKLNLVKTNTGNTAALKTVNIVKTVASNRVALKAVVAKTVSGNTVALRGTRTATAHATVALRGTTASRASSDTAALKRLHLTHAAQGNTVSLYDSRSSHAVRAKKNTVALKPWTVLDEFPQPNAVLTELDLMTSTLVEVQQASVAFAVVAPVETAIFPTISWTIDTTVWTVTSLTEVRTDAAEAWYDTELYDVSMYGETQAPVLIEQSTAAAQIAAIERAFASLVPIDVTCAIEPVGTTRGALYDDQFYDQYFYDDTRTSIIEVGITEYPQANAAIRRV